MGQKDTIIVDLDGTLADESHRNHWLHPTHSPDCNFQGPMETCDCGAKRNWKEYYDRVAHDDPVWAVIELVWAMRDAGFQIVILTGRVEHTRRETERWLKDHSIEYNVLRMRPDDVFTQDDKLKVSWAEEMQLKDRTLFVLEDRSRVVEAWRQAGYRCFQVAPGTF